MKYHQYHDNGNHIEIEMKKINGELIQPQHRDCGELDFDGRIGLKKERDQFF